MCFLYIILSTTVSFLDLTDAILFLQGLFFPLFFGSFYVFYFVLCVMCLTVFVNCFVKQFAICVGVVAVLLLNVMEVFSVGGGALLDGPCTVFQIMCVLCL